MSCPHSHQMWNISFTEWKCIGCGAEFDHVDGWDIEMKTVKNLMTGKEIRIAKDTPNSCDPSSELYWSM